MIIDRDKFEESEFQMNVYATFFISVRLGPCIGCRLSAFRKFSVGSIGILSIGVYRV